MQVALNHSSSPAAHRVGSVRGGAQDADKKQAEVKELAAKLQTSEAALERQREVQRRCRFARCGCQH